MFERGGEGMTELAKLRKENEELRKEQDLMFMLFDVILTAVEIEKKKHGLFSKENTNQSRSDSSNQIGMLLDKIGKLDKESTRDRLLAFFEGLQSSK